MSLAELRFLIRWAKPTGLSKVQSQELGEIVDVLNEIKTTKKGPFHAFNAAYFDKIKGTRIRYELERTFYRDPRKVLERIDLVYYLLQKLEKHRVFYGCSIVGFNGVLVD